MSSREFWDAIFLVGYGALELKPAELWALTPVELYHMMSGYRWRAERQYEMLAWHAANVMQPHVKKRLSVPLLLGRVQSSRMPTSREEFDAMMSRAKRTED